MTDIYLTISLSTHNGDDTPQNYAHLGSFFFFLQDSLGGRLELQQRNMAVLKCYQIMGHKEPVN
jgi:hypothetical protein